MPDTGLRSSLRAFCWVAHIGSGESTQGCHAHTMRFMQTYFRFTLTLLACIVEVFFLPATAEVLDADLSLQCVPLGVPCGS